MPADALVIPFYGAGVRATLACEASRCVVEVALDRPPDDDQPAPPADLELLLQPRDAGGWPAGSARRLLAAALAWRASRDGRRWLAFVPLPGFGPELLRRCHFRVQRHNNAAA
jgi:hypothetical protein